MYFKVKMQLLLLCAASIACSFGAIFEIHSKPDASVETDSYNSSWRVVGGRDALPGEVTYIVSLLYNQNHRCGGVIIHPRWIATACHCFADVNVRSLTIAVGSSSLKPIGDEYAIGPYKCHELYGTNGYVYDIAVLYIPFGIRLDPGRVQTVPLCQQNNDPEDCLLSGWGRTSSTGPIPNNLQVLNLTSLTHAQCQSHWPNMVDVSNICTLTRAGEGACSGDSGGPLVTVNGEKCLLGLVNWGSPCAQGMPDVFVRISYFLDWIKNNTDGAI